MLITVSIIFISLGALIKYGKLYVLIAGYNTMSKEEQNTYDIEGIANVFRNAMFGMAFLLILGFIAGQYFEISNIEMFSLFAALAIGLPYLLIVSNSDKYKIKKDK